MTEPITSFRDDYRFLSNFWPAPVVLDDVQYPSVENAYQAAKTFDTEERVPFISISPNAAKKRARPKDKGGSITIRESWDDARLEVMLFLLRQKFAIPELRKRLLATGDRELVEGNWWGDTFWGVCRKKGENHLGKLLMQVRGEVK